MRRPWWLRTPLVAGSTACTLSAAAGVWALALALRVEPAPAVRSASVARPATEFAAPGASGMAQAALDGILDRNPFRADRQRPPRRFALPGTVTTARVTAPSVALTLTGTVIYPGGGGFALVRAPGRSPVMVRVGEVVEGHTLRSVARDEATFLRPGGGSMVLRVPKAGG